MGVLLEDIIRTFDLKIMHAGPDKKTVEEFEINRPGLQLAGYYDFFQPKRIQVLGKAESYFVKSMSSKTRQTRCDRLLKNSLIPCVIIANKNEVIPDLLESAKKYNQWLLWTDRETSILKVDLTLFLQKELAESLQLHGTLMDVYGVGVLITGESGIGKSETALSLIQNNHILIADDSVVITRMRSDILIGSGPQLTQGILEIRGIGVIDIRSLYGLRAVRSDKRIDIVIHFETWNQATQYERLGDTYETMDILGSNLPIIKIPVRPGRTLASVVEAAAINYRQNQMGINTAMLLDERIIKQL